MHKMPNTKIHIHHENQKSTEEEDKKLIDSVSGRMSGVEILHKNGIYIDEFSKNRNGHENGKAYFLTQSHLDHRKSSLKRFKPVIYCSYITSLLIKAKHVIILQPGHWYTIHGDIEVFVAETLHCPGSLMFYFKKLNILHLGDTRIDRKILQYIKEWNPKTILYDNLFSKFHGFIPSIESSTAMLNHVLTQFHSEKKQVHFCLCHTGTILLLQILKQRVKPDVKTLKPDVLFLLQHLDLVDISSHVTAVGLKSKEIDIIVASQYFIVNKLNPNEIVHDESNCKDIIRIFVSFHSCANDLHLLNDYYLEALDYD